MKKTPDALVIISVILLIVVGATWLIPAGSFERALVNGREVVVPGTYTQVEAAPQSFLQALTAPLRGIESAADIIGFVLLVGGAFTMLMKTGAIDAILLRMLKLAKDKPAWRVGIIPLLMTVFSIGGYSFGMSEEVLVFVLITIPLARSLGYDNIVGVAIPFVGAGVGFAGAAFNPFTVGIAQGLAGVDLFSGFFYRTIVWAFFSVTAFVFVMRYASKVAKEPSLRFIAEGEHHDLPETVELTNQRVLVLVAFLLSLVAIMVGALYFDWYIGEISALFLVLGIVAALLVWMPVGDAVKAFYQGAKDLLPAAIIIGLSKSILVVAQDGKIIDTILFHLAGAVDDLPRVVAIQVMFFVQFAINFFIPSGSGQAAITIPIMAPLADLLGITRQTAILAYQFGDGLCNLVIPTSGVTMGVLAIGGIPFAKWIKWVWKLMLILIVLAMIFLALPLTLFEWV